MPGGIHADHGHVEWFTGQTFSATSKPFTDAQIDAMCVAAEQLIVAELEPSNSLPTAADVGWRQIVVTIVIAMMQLGDKWGRVRGAISESSEGAGTSSFPEFGVDVITPAIRRRIKSYERRMTTSYSVKYGETVG